MSNQPARGSRGHYISAIPDDLWQDAQTAAEFRGESVSAAVRRFLREYTDPRIIPTLSLRRYAEPTEAELAEMTVEQLNAYSDTFDE